MNKGNPRIILRCEPRLLELLALELERTNSRRKGRPFDRSAWIRQAMIDKLRHSARARGASTGELADLDAFPETGV
jgi:hypothetical protein